MRKFVVHWEGNVVGYQGDEPFEVEDDATEDEIREIAEEMALQHFSWGYEEEYSAAASAADPAPSVSLEAGDRASSGRPSAAVEQSAAVFFELEAIVSQNYPRCEMDDASDALVRLITEAIAQQRS